MKDLMERDGKPQLRRFPWRVEAIDKENTTRQEKTLQTRQRPGWIMAEPLSKFQFIIERLPEEK